MTAGQRPKRPVETVETAFEIIALLLDGGPQGLTEISGELGLAPSTVHRHMQTLQYHEFVVRENSRFSIGLRFLDYGIRARNAQEVYETGEQQVDILADETGERTRLTTLENGRSVLLYQRKDRHHLETSSFVGQRRPIHSLADGKAMLALLDRDEVEAIVETHGLVRYTENTITTREALFEELDATRERGYGLNLEEVIPGLNAVGVAIKNEAGRPIGAMSISGPASRLDQDTLEGELAKELMGAANEVEIKLTYA